jgi:hypothetical protein
MLAVQVKFYDNAKMIERMNNYMLTHKNDKPLLLKRGAFKCIGRARTVLN